jgi:hypothetical protein
VRLARPQIAKSVFLRSGVDFDLYISGMCWATSRPIAGTWFMLHSIVRDPLNWRHELDVLRDIARWFLRRGNPDLAGPSTRAIKGLAFNSLQPDARCGFRDTGN